VSNEFIELFLASFDDSTFPDDFLNTYEPMECLSQNEMGETLLVKNRCNGNYCVAKCYEDKTLLSHTTENDLLKRMHHQGLPIFISEHQNDKMLCVVRKFVRGKPLDKLAQENPPDRQQALSICVQLCDILTYLHGQTPPIIHRDIKPQNIIMDEQEKIKLIDFGISRTYSETEEVDTVFLGTKHFTAPEQYGFSQTDCRSDIFSLGVVLCWLLSGEMEINKALSRIKNYRLAKIIKKCTAFAPKDRYQNAVQVKDALTGRTIHRRILASLCVGVLIAASGFFSRDLINHQFSPVVKFEEPMIEQAVRLSLDKEEGEIINEDELLSVTALYVFGDKAAADEESITDYANQFVNNDGTILRGQINSLADVTKLKNLRTIYLAYQNIADLTPLSQLGSLESVELKHNPIVDVSPLSQVPSLISLGLFDTLVSDLTALSRCTRLISVDVGYTNIKSMTALDGLESLQVIAIRKAPLINLDHIETHAMLEQIYLSETHLMDLAPLLELPHLQQVEISENLRPAAEAIAEQAQFKIIYQ
jgi:serine/threonine protein kinase